MLTFLPLEEIEKMESWEGSELNKAKEILAYELTALVHGEEEANKAKEASRNSYSPFSRFAVGAAVITASGKIYQGCNVENSSFGLTNCAERTAIFKAVRNNYRASKNQK